MATQDFLNDVQQLLNRFQINGHIELLDPAMIQKSAESMNAAMDDIRREYRQRERTSQIDASRTLLTA